MTVAHHNAENELEEVSATIEAYSTQLMELDGVLAEIQKNQSNDDVSRQIVEYEGTGKTDPKNIAAEDALDRIIRLQNTLKIVRRRNELLSREHTTHEKQLRDRSHELLKTTAELDEVVDKTGWWDGYEVDHEGQVMRKDDIQEMNKLEQKLRKEMVAAKLIISKKEQLILQLQGELDKQGEHQARLNSLFNDIRVKEKECKEIQVALERMRHDDAKNDQALTVLGEKSANTSLMCMEEDKGYLKNTVSEMKMIVQRQNEVVKAQISRQVQLSDRLAVVMKSLEELKLRRAYERNVSKSDLVPSASREEPEDISLILPNDEQIPIDTYRLLYRHNEMMRTNVARKNMIALEKESVIQALDAKLSKYVASLQLTSNQQESTKYDKDVEMSELMGDLKGQHQAYRRRIEELLSENGRLKAKLFRPTSKRAQIRRV